MIESVSHKNSPDDYLRVIWGLSFPTGELAGFRHGPRPTAPARIAEQLDVSRASCGEMLTRLTDRGLVSRGARKEAVLTAAGRIAAMRIVRRYRIVETMAVQLLAYTPWEAAEVAKQLVDGFSDDAVERLFRALDEPVRNPQGTPIDPDFQLRENPTLTSMIDLRPNVDVTVVRTEVLDAGSAVEVATVGLVPGSTVRVIPAAAAGSDPSISINGAPPVAVSSTALRHCFFRDTGVPEIPAQAACWAGELATRAAGRRDIQSDDSGHANVEQR